MSEVYVDMDEHGSAYPSEVLEQLSKLPPVSETRKDSFGNIERVIIPLSDGSFLHFVDSPLNNAFTIEHQE
jgi:hypothetical protein